MVVRSFGIGDNLHEIIPEEAGQIIILQPDDHKLSTMELCICLHQRHKNFEMFPHKHLGFEQLPLVSLRTYYNFSTTKVTSATDVLIPSCG